MPKKGKNDTESTPAVEDPEEPEKAPEEMTVEDMEEMAKDNPGITVKREKRETADTPPPERVHIQAVQNALLDDALAKAKDFVRQSELAGANGEIFGEAAAILAHAKAQPIKVRASVDGESKIVSVQLSDIKASLEEQAGVYAQVAKTDQRAFKEIVHGLSRLGIDLQNL